MSIKQLAKIIKSNPGCVALIDNDNWRIYRKEDFEDGLEKPIARGEGCYGSEILEALALIVGIKIESV